MYTIVVKQENHAPSVFLRGAACMRHARCHASHRVGVVAGRARRRVPRASVFVEAVVDMLEREQQTFGQLLARAVVGQVPGRSQGMVRDMAQY